MAPHKYGKCPDCGQKGIRPVSTPYGKVKCKYCHSIFKPKINADGTYATTVNGEYIAIK